MSGKTQHQVVAGSAENAKARVLHDSRVEVAREEHVVHARRSAPSRADLR